MKRTTIALSAAAALLMVGCGNSTKEAKVITDTKVAAVPVAAAPVEKKAEATPSAAPKTAASKKPAAQATAQMQAPKKPAPATAKAPKAAPIPVLSKFYTVFSDGAQIAPKDGKPLLLVFGQPADPYTQKLQTDVTENSGLAKAITDTMTPVYINAAAEKRHKFLHNGEMMDVDTKTLVSIYHLDATPTLIFMDDKSQSIFMVPGYMPPKQFEVTLQFVKEGAWKGKDRKNGDVYQALKSYYEAHGIQVGKAQK